MPSTISHGQPSHRRSLLALGVAIAIAAWCVASAAEDPNGAPQSASKTDSRRVADPTPQESVNRTDIADFDITAVVEIWKKLRGGKADTEGDAEALARALQEVEQQSKLGQFGEPEDALQIQAEALAQKPATAENSEPTAKEDAKLLRFALLGYAWQKKYDQELANRATVLRNAAREIDKVAAELEDVDAYKRADHLFEVARSMRDEARDFRQQRLSADSSYNSEKAALKHNLHALRVQIQLYRSEHDGRNPEVNPGADGNPSLPQLLANTNEKGEIGTGPEFRLGPYMVDIPKNPLAPDGTGHIVVDVNEWPPKKTEPTAGWLYHPRTGQIVPNTRGLLQVEEDEF
jgi:hypothetical protein